MPLLRKIPEWLSLQDIALAWSEETGESAQALEGNFREWFKEFLVRDGYLEAGTGGTADEPGILENLLERPIWRDTFETFCEERGLAKPRFWFPDESEGQPLAQPAKVPVSEAATAEGKKAFEVRVGGVSVTWIALALVLIVALGAVALWMLGPNDRVADRERNRQPGGEQVLALVLSVEQGLPAPAPAESKPAKGLVLLIQGELEAVGFDPGPIDGKPGPRLKAAIEAYQRARSFPIDGRVSVGLLSRLAQDSPRQSRSAPVTTAAGPVGTEEIQPRLKSTPETVQTRAFSGWPSARGVEDQVLFLHLTSVRSVYEVHHEWNRLSRSFPEQFSDLSLVTETVELGDQGVFHRILAGPIHDPTDAERRCNRIAAEGQYCRVHKRAP